MHSASFVTTTGTELLQVQLQVCALEAQNGNGLQIEWECSAVAWKDCWCSVAALQDSNHVTDWPYIHFLAVYRCTRLTRINATGFCATGASVTISNVMYTAGTHLARDIPEVQWTPPIPYLSMTALETSNHTSKNANLKFHLWRSEKGPHCCHQGYFCIGLEHGMGTVFTECHSLGLVLGAFILFQRSQSTSALFQGVGQM